MTLPQLEKLGANLVVVTEMEGTFNFSLGEVQKILKDATVQVIGQPTPLAMQITSLREQAVVTLEAPRIIFQDQSANIPPKLQLAEIASNFINLIGEKGINRFKAYGFNFDVVFDAKGESPAATTIMERFVKADQVNERGSVSLAGAGVRLYFPAEPATCELRIEPHENRVDSVQYFSHVNYNYELDGASFPSPETVKSDFGGKWNIFTQLLERLLM
jgi:hypothetical protein